MNNQDITSLLINKLNLEKAYVTGDTNHIKIIVIGNLFKDMSQVKRQQIVYTPLIKMITEKHIHAVSIMSYTPEEWKKNKKLY
ncbi:putative DNA-binding transcriptional regulator [Buchnera aphidicola str. Ak (Acyrthosiphon kondoi)]|uniref:Putative DNA-binding transcriptional regulator n=1 Tax=Buchnera aphidicola str. Ak (Acyrthosiphon kondoi) TaxID=1005090 RepID=G2LN92_9GAMM|nr:BolA family protein [Buchnera aphidicola]AEO08730.1 putative DNA-binding transcriptional regulator [Buchnera aphidicola str. Ak (Acyrthosiphon kondoi)]WAI18463.1 MAG: BolA family transcriptional regulator [Buchnera aphidicola (Acyrthosiphon caraganae)]